MLLKTVLTNPDTRTYFILPVSTFDVPFLAIARGKEERKQVEGARRNKAFEKFSASLAHSLGMVDSNTANG